MRDTLYTQALAREALPSAGARTNGTVNGTSVDTGVFGNDFRSVLLVVQTGTITDGSHAITVQDSADGSSWATADSALIQGSLPTIVAADDGAVFQFGYLANRQYVRLVATTSGATTGGVFSAVAVLYDASSTPVARA